MSGRAGGLRLRARARHARGEMDCAKFELRPFMHVLPFVLGSVYVKLFTLKYDLFCVCRFFYEVMK